ncbi:MAG: hypothetical protein LBL08_01515 [Candidatus Nomurabacteria bacterium]|nr:hypothetical protein [Candidatus Nomurabacteria bacterium]
MARNSDWGAIAYLATSSYGRNATEVWINNNDSYTTGCAGDSVSASSVSTCNQYSTVNGVHASTTDNTYGIYDMSGGSWEYVMSNRGAISNTSSMATIPQTRYMDTYYVGPFGIKLSASASSDEQYYNFDVCTFLTCGGQALSETTRVQSVSALAQLWSSDDSVFVNSNGGPWALRGAYHFLGARTGIFAAYCNVGSAASNFSFRPLMSKF